MDKQVDTPKYHAGEIRVQARAGVQDTASRNARAISNSLPRGALSFVQQQGMAVFGSADADGRIWCSIIFGQPGFLQAPDVNTLLFDSNMIGMSTSDPFWRNIVVQPQVGLLLIELSTRRRLRINGQLNKTTDNLYTLAIEQAYPNCPKYIQRRHCPGALTLTHDNEQAIDQGTVLSDKQQRVIHTADTFFVASAFRDSHAQYHVDASHRGGHPGFVQILDDQRLLIPDYVGNSMFNTLGNIESYPYAGLIFIDFAHRRLLQLTGQARILWEHDIASDTTGGTRRYWDFTLTHWQEYTLPFELDCEFLDYSPYLPEKNGV